MSFRLFGVNVEIQLWFWVMTVMFGWGYREHPILVVTWVAVVLFSVLVHEFGHAFAVMRHRIEPEIALHGMGGTTRWNPILPLGRLDMIIISAAGPAAGFVLGGVVYAVKHLAPELVAQLGLVGLFTIEQLLWVNFGWGIMNLLPVFPFDGGHILEHALGPRRARLTAGISLVVAALVAVVFAYRYQEPWIAMLFGFSAIQSYQRLRSVEPELGRSEVARKWAPPPEDALPRELTMLLNTARRTLAEERFDAAITLAKQVIDGDGGTTPVPPRAVLEGLEIIAWAHLLAGRLEAAGDHLAQAKKLGEPDRALAGAVLFARRDLNGARRVLEEARSRGDDRKEVVGPLIQILIEQGDVARASAVALDIVESLSAEDARRMAQIALEHRAYDWSARLYGSVFERNKEANDAYDAARALALEGNHERALEWLRKAVEAGFEDRARAWSDAALEALRASSGLETVLPRP
jgi:Zn-dependent protease